LPSLTRSGLRTIILVAAIVVIAACLATLVALVTSTEGPVRGGSAVLVGAGDIAKCLSDADNATAELLDDIPGTVFTVGDNVYSSKVPWRFALCYGPSWGRHKDRTRPAPGNHEYLNSQDATDYFEYFGSAAGPPSRGYYSFDKGDWHVVALDSNCEQVRGGCGASSPMVGWLQRDLAAHRSRCTLAYFHHPLFSSGEHGNQPQVRPIWEALYAADADVMVSAHDHSYERFAPQRPDGTRDEGRGIREFVVGTGGGEHYPFGATEPNSQVRNATTYGVLKIALSPRSYAWEFVPVEGESFTDSGHDRCH
jgi:acid phosphatase type 7